MMYPQSQHDLFTPKQLDPLNHQNLLRVLRRANAYYRVLARDIRHSVRPTYHARRRALLLGLVVDVQKAADCPQLHISVDPLPLLAKTPNPDEILMIRIPARPKEVILSHLDTRHSNKVCASARRYLPSAVSVANATSSSMLSPIPIRLSQLPAPLLFPKCPDSSGYNMTSRSSARPISCASLDVPTSAVIVDELTMEEEEFDILSRHQLQELEHDVPTSERSDSSLPKSPPKTQMKMEDILITTCSKRKADDANFLFSPVVYERHPKVCALVFFFFKEFIYPSLPLFLFASFPGKTGLFLSLDPLYEL